jgi:hypothetical protein
MRRDLRRLLERYDYRGDLWGTRGRDEIYRIMASDWKLTPDEVEAEIDVVGLPTYHDQTFHSWPNDKRRFRRPPSRRPA